jgi:hypothetical protein
MAAGKNASAARKEVLDMLIEDHKSVKKLFREFEKLDVEDDSEEAESLVALTCAELKLHTQLEEECFYPAVRAALKEADLVDEAEVEHASAKQLIEQLETMDIQDPKLAATFKVLGEYVKHHVKEEESEMFPQLQRARIEWEQLLGQMMQRRNELELELGLAEDEEMTEEEDAGAGVEASTSTTSMDQAEAEEASANGNAADGEAGEGQRKSGRGKRQQETVE